MRNEHCTQAQAQGGSEISEIFRTATRLSGIPTVTQQKLSIVGLSPLTGGEPPVSTDKTPKIG